MTDSSLISNVVDIRQKNPLQTHAKYIWIKRELDSRYIEFYFAIDDPSLFVELILPQEAFREFCRVNSVVHMSAEQIAAVEAEAEKWRYGKDTLVARSKQ